MLPSAVGNGRRGESQCLRIGALGLAFAAAGVLAAEPGPAAVNSALIEAGRRIYEQGVLPDGTPLVALRAGGVRLSGDLAACANCHRRSGFGQVEGRSLVPAVAGNVLFAPGRFHASAPPRGKAAPGMTVTASPRDRRPAYDRATLAHALREGVDPAGRPFDDLMPRYVLDDPAADALAAYLRQLSSGPAPGVTADALHVATIVAPDMSPARRRVVVDVLEAWFAQYRSGRRWVLQVWDLAGAPDSWETQLERSYRQQPVFAVLSGLGGADWQPVHRFCERMRLPCVLPNVELAPATEGDFYSLYYSPGIALEARALAAHLRESAPRPPRVVQVYADGAGEWAAEALRDALGDALRLEARRFDAASPAAALQGLTEGDVLVLWLRSPQIDALAAATDPQAMPASLYVSAMLSPPEATALPGSWRPRAAFVTVFDDPARIDGQAGLALLPWLREKGLEPGDLRLQADTYGAAFFFTNALGRMTGPTNRELLMETLERAVETKAAAPSYPGLSLGPNQRQAVKSAGILRYRPPDYRQLQPSGRRIVP